MVGFQYWKADKYFASAMFNFALETTISGAQSDFGGALLNPSTSGYSAIFQGSYTLVHPTGRHLLLSVAFKGGGTREKWQTASNAQTGWVLHAVPSLQFGTDTLTFEDNEYQFGIQAGPSVRALIGDLASSKNDAFRSDVAVLGTSSTGFLGAELTVFARLNTIRPFFRITWHNSDIDSFSHWQAFLGLDVLSNLFLVDTTS